MELLCMTAAHQGHSGFLTQPAPARGRQKTQMPSTARNSNTIQATEQQQRRRGRSCDEDGPRAGFASQCWAGTHPPMGPELLPVPPSFTGIIWGTEGFASPGAEDPSLLTHRGRTSQNPQSVAAMAIKILTWYESSLSSSQLYSPDSRTSSRTQHPRPRQVSLLSRRDSGFGDKPQNLS